MPGAFDQRQFIRIEAVHRGLATAPVIGMTLPADYLAFFIRLAEGNATGDI
ncbi:MAG: hypothetical protein AB7E24_12465 [Novosphingobium sp.]